MLEKLSETVGRALGIHAGAQNLTVTNNELTGINASIEVSSSAFGYGERIPARFTADGEGISPPLEWRCVPADADAVVIMVEDADSPTPKPLVHAIVWDLPGVDGSLPEGILPKSSQVGERARRGESLGDAPQPASAAQFMGRNSYSSAAYLPPDPPRGHGLHRYVFQVFALNKALKFASEPGRAALIDAIRDHVIAKGMLIGTYERS